MERNKSAPVHFEGSQPILRVENMKLSLRFYIDVLGFENASWGTTISQASFVMELRLLVLRR